MWGIWETAHSTLLEMAVELGLPFAGLVVVAWIIGLAVLVRGVWIWRRDVVVPIAAISVAALALAHSLIDFSLQIPGYAIVVFALLGAGLSQSFSSRGKNTALGMPNCLMSRQLQDCAHSAIATIFRARFIWINPEGSVR